MRSRLKRSLGSHLSRVRSDTIGSARSALEAVVAALLEVQSNEFPSISEEQGGKESEEGSSPTNEDLQASPPIEIVLVAAGKLHQLSERQIKELISSISEKTLADKIQL